MIMVKKNIKYVLLFIYYFICLSTIYFIFRMDTYNNYGFSYGIVTGSVPYRDFNLIVPLFGPFLYSILLFINHSILTFYLEQSLLLVILSYFLFRLLNNKAWICIVLIFFTNYCSICILYVSRL